VVHNQKRLWILYILVLSGMAVLIISGSGTVSVMAENGFQKRETCFIVDPGHGGVDGGATSCTGKLESAFNLEIGLRLNDLLAFLGYDTAMIRKTDISVYTQGNTIARKKVSDLKERVRICNETNGAILLSIHQNTFSDSRYYGPQVFFADTEGSRELAEAIQASLQHDLAENNNRTAKKAEGIYLMEYIQCPGVLIECGFLSNAQEEARLRNPEYQKKLCCVIAAAAVSYANT